MRPLSNDLREHVVAAVGAGDSCRSVAARFGVVASTVVKWSQPYRATGSVTPATVGGHRETVLNAHAVPRIRVRRPVRDWLRCLVLEVVNARPVAARMRVEFVGVAAAFDVRPHVAVLGHGKVTRMRAGPDVALAVHGYPFCEVAGMGQQLDGRRAAPAVHVPGRLPAALIERVGALLHRLPLLDDAPQVGRQRGRVGHLQTEYQRGEQRNGFTDRTYGGGKGQVR